MSYKEIANFRSRVEGITIENKKEDGTTEKRVIPAQVRGWDDPRLFTLVALRRRGIPAKALLSFVGERKPSL
jgi:glutaminyl-tRNA synthetase